jgi:hypothetical protein
MSELFRISLAENAISNIDIYSPTAVATTRQIAGSLIIHSPKLETIDNAYSSTIIVERMLWADINYAHIILTPNGNYYLALIAGPDLFNDYRILFIPLNKESAEISQERVNAFSNKLLSKIEKGEVSCYPEDINWI